MLHVQCNVYYTDTRMVKAHRILQVCSSQFFNVNICTDANIVAWQIASTVTNARRSA